MRIGYADPPYIGCAYLYKDHPDYAGEVDQVALVERLDREFDGWVLHTHATAEAFAILGPAVKEMGARWCSWNKTFASFKPNVPVAFAWEPVIVKEVRKPVVKPGMIYRDWFQCPITLQRGLTGVKPEPVCHWLFEILGADPTDELHDLFPGTGAVSRAWETWKAQPWLPLRAPITSSLQQE